MTLAPRRAASFLAPFRSPRLGSSLFFSSSLPCSRDLTDFPFAPSNSQSRASRETAFELLSGSHARNRLGDRFDGAYRWKAAKLEIDRNWQLEASPPRGIASIDRMHRESENGQGQCRPFPPLNFVVSPTFGFRSVARHRDRSLSLLISLFASELIKRFLAGGAAACVRATKSFTATNDESAKPYKNCRPNAFPDIRGQLRADVFPFPLRERWSSCELCRARLVTIGGIGIITASSGSSEGTHEKGADSPR